MFPNAVLPLALVLGVARGLKVTQFVLVDAEADVELFDVNDGDVIYLDELPTDQLSVKAEASSDTESVKFRLTGDQTKHRFETSAPYALFGGPGDDYRSGLGTGDFRLRATPYSRDVGGREGTSLEIEFSLIGRTSDPDCMPRTLTVTGCTAETILAALHNQGCDFYDDKKDVLDASCRDAKKKVDQLGTKRLVDEGMLFGWNSEDLQIYADGGGKWNEETDNPDDEDSKIKNQAKLVKRIFDDFAQSRRFQWYGIPNFQQEAIPYEDSADYDPQPSGCQINAAMCCWVRDRQANDNNGNCADNDCDDADPMDNTDICYADSSRAPLSPHVEAGLHWYTKPYEEGDAHCHGFAWNTDEASDSYRFAGNAFFFVSMYDHLYTRGYVENVPGAPMCACIEKMPTVSRSDCTQVDVTEKWKINFNGDGEITGTRRLSLDIEYNACNGGETANDLYSEFATDEIGGNLAAIRRYLVGPSDNNKASNCPSNVPV